MCQVASEDTLTKFHWHDCPNLSWTRTTPLDTPKWTGKSPQDLNLTQGTVGNTEKIRVGEGSSPGESTPTGYLVPSEDCMLLILLPFPVSCKDSTQVICQLDQCLQTCWHDEQTEESSWSWSLDPRVIGVEGSSVHTAELTKCEQQWGKNWIKSNVLGKQRQKKVLLGNFSDG